MRFTNSTPAIVLFLTFISAFLAVGAAPTPYPQNREKAVLAGQANASRGQHLGNLAVTHGNTFNDPQHSTTHLGMANVNAPLNAQGGMSKKHFEDHAHSVAHSVQQMYGKDWDVKSIRFGNQPPSI